MSGEEIDNALDICAKLALFGGSRAGRELWACKPRTVQDADLRQFAKDIGRLRMVIKRMDLEIRNLMVDLEEARR